MTILVCLIIVLFNTLPDLKVWSFITIVSIAVTLSHPAVRRGSKGHSPSKGQVTLCSSAHEKKKGALHFTINVLEESNST